MSSPSRRACTLTLGCLIAPLLVVLGPAWGSAAPGERDETAGSRHAPPAASAPELPEGTAVWEKMRAAMGGSEAIAALESLHAEVTLTIGSRELELETWATGIDMVLVRQPVPQLGADIIMGRNGPTSWIEAPIAGAREVRSGEIEQFTQIGSMHLMLLRLGQTYAGIATTEQTIYAGRSCLVLTCTDPVEGAPNGTPTQLTVLVDARTHLPAGVRRPAGNDAGSRATEFTFDLWDKEGDLVLFREMEVRTPRSGRAAGSVQMVTYERLRLNAADAYRFDVPPGLKTLSPPTGPPADPAPESESRSE